MARLGERRALPHDEPPAPGDAATARRYLAEAGRAGLTRLGLLELAPVLAAYGIPVAAGHLARTPADVATLAGRVGPRLALKLVSPDISHKSDVGGVQLDVSPLEAAEAGRGMLARVAALRPEARITGVLVQPMVAPGVELLLGAAQDSQFGPLVMVGFGGIYVEVLRDTTARLAPVTAIEAEAMLSELRLAPVLGGLRGAPAVDRPALVQSVCRFARLAAELPELVEVEINPLMASPGGVMAVDVRATLADGAAA
jgi:acetyltransferase